MSQPDNDLIGVSEAADLASVSRGTIKRLAADGTLPVHTKMPGATGAYLFRRADVERFAKERAA